LRGGGGEGNKQFAKLRDIRVVIERLRRNQFRPRKEAKTTTRASHELTERCSLAEHNSFLLLAGEAKSILRKHQQWVSSLPTANNKIIGKSVMRLLSLALAPHPISENPIHNNLQTE
jgi:hypothetical protein